MVRWKGQGMIRLDYWWLPPLLNIVLIAIGLFMILLILIQRGKGGGLAGAFGGLGGSSPFGSRAGDAFMRATIYVACVWLFFIMVQVISIQDNARSREYISGGIGAR